jgi:hypothetical protein
MAHLGDSTDEYATGLREWDVGQPRPRAAAAMQRASAVFYDYSEHEGNWVGQQETDGPPGA